MYTLTRAYTYNTHTTRITTTTHTYTHNHTHTTHSPIHHHTLAFALAVMLKYSGVGIILREVCVRALTVIVIVLPHAIVCCTNVSVWKPKGVSEWQYADNVMWCVIKVKNISSENAIDLYIYVWKPKGVSESHKNIFLEKALWKMKGSTTRIMCYRNSNCPYISVWKQKGVSEWQCW